MKNVFACDGKSIFGYFSLNKPLNHLFNSTIINKILYGKIKWIELVKLFVIIDYHYIKISERTAVSSSSAGII